MLATRSCSGRALRHPITSNAGAARRPAPTTAKASAKASANTSDRSSMRVLRPFARSYASPTPAPIRPLERADLATAAMANDLVMTGDWPDEAAESANGNDGGLSPYMPLPVSMPTLLNSNLGSVMDPPSCSVVPKKTHVVCTLGPSSRTVPQLCDLLTEGMSVARFNFSHGSHEYHKETLDNLREACRLTGKLCAVLLDTKGPEIRTGALKGGKAVSLEKGTLVTLTNDYTREGDATTIPISYSHIARDLTRGSQVLMADGAVMMEVLETYPERGTVECLMLNSAKLGERKNCNLPGVVVDLPTLTEKDVEDLVQFGVKHQVDFIAASFVRKGSDIALIRNVLGEAGRTIRIIAKVENHEGLVNFDSILAAADGVMVARGDLGMEIPLTKIFWVQKMMIRKCNMAAKPVVTATQMLDSMIAAPRPTRAEATDVANAVLDGTDCVMLSGETAAGAYPLEAVEVMSGICEEAEACVDNDTLTHSLVQSTLTSEPMSTIESLASSAVLTASKVHAKIIVVLASSGNAARYIAKYRPDQPIVVGVVPLKRRATIGFDSSNGTPEAQVARQCLLTRGLIPVIVTDRSESESAPEAAKNCVLESIEYARSRGLVAPGDKVVSMYNVERQCAVIRVVRPIQPPVAA